MNIEKAAIVGAGAMGCGIAQVLSQAGITVILKDVEQSYVDKGLANIKRMYDSRVKKEVLTQEQADDLYKLVSGTVNYEGFGDVDLVIEAALEQIDVKLKVFKELDSVCPKKAILATNTSALSVSEIACATERPEKLVGMHFFNPAEIMKLVEVIPGVKTSPETVDTLLQLCARVKKVAVKVQECPGFLVNRLLFPYMNEALYVLQEGLAEPEAIDNAAVEFGMPMGPFALFDMTGMDICAHVNNFLCGEYGPRFETAALLNELMKAGHLGQKTGSGFYIHEKGVVPKKGEPKKVNPELAALVEAARKVQPIVPPKPKNTKVLAPGPGHERQDFKVSSGEDFDPTTFDVHRIILPMFNEAVYALQESVVEAKDIDVAMQWGCGLTRGLMTLADQNGLDWCLDQLDLYHHSGGGERFRSSWLLRKLVRGGIKNFAGLAPSPAPQLVH